VPDAVELDGAPSGLSSPQLFVSGYCERYAERMGNRGGYATEFFHI